MPTGRVQGATMTMRTDTREATFVGDVKAHLVSTAQPGQAAPATPAFGRDSASPIDVTSDQLYVNDLAKTALFMGKVVAVQGDSTLKAPELHIAYEGKAAAEHDCGGSAPQQPGEGSRLSRLVAKNGTVVTIGADRRVSSDEVEFDAKADTALFIGNVLVNQLKNVLQGKRLFIDRKAGTSRLETPAEGGQPAGRIAATFYQNDTKGAAQPKPKPKSAAANKARRRAGRRVGLLQDGSQRAHGYRGRHARRVRHREACRLPRQRQVEARRLRRAHRGDGRLLHGSGRTRARQRRRRGCRQDASRS